MIERYFRLTESRTTVRQELLGGLTTFLTMAYIVVVNPQILSQAGMPSDGTAVGLKVRSDSAGRFAFRGLPPLAQDGRLMMYLFATHPRYEGAEYHFNRNEPPQSDVDFTLRPGSLIGGTVRDDAARSV